MNGYNHLIALINGRGLNPIEREKAKEELKKLLQNFKK